MTDAGVPLVLNTRPRGAAAEALDALLRVAGLQPFGVPTTEIVGGWDPVAARHVADRLRAGSYEWLVFPSANAARYLFEAVHASTEPRWRAGRPLLPLGGGEGEDVLGWPQAARLLGTHAGPPPLPTTPNVLCGAGTAEALVARGAMPRVVLARFSAAAALERLLAEQATAVLLPRAHDGRDELADGLRARGVRVDELVVYRTVPIIAPELAEAARLLRERRVAGVALTSPSAAASLARGLRTLGAEPRQTLAGATLACLGATTARAVEALGLGKPVVADETRLEALVRVLRASAVVGAAPP